MWSCSELVVTVVTSLLHTALIRKRRLRIGDVASLLPLVVLPGFASAMYWRPLISFVSSKNKQTVTPVRASDDGWLSGGNDWKLLFDLGHFTEFLHAIAITPLRPDILINSTQQKRLIMLELTCPYEANIRDAHSRKYDKYRQLMADICKDGWHVTLHPFEVSARGLVAASTITMLKRLGFKRLEINKCSRELSLSCMRASYAIFLSRFNKAWSPPDIDEPSANKKHKNK